MFPPPAALPPTRRAGAGTGSGNGLRERAPGMGSGNGLRECALGMCPGNALQSLPCLAARALCSQLGSSHCLPVLGVPGKEPSVHIHGSWGYPGSFPGLSWVLGSWRSSRDPFVGAFLPRSWFLAEQSLGRAGAAPPARDPPAHGASPPAALGLPSPGIPAEEADREGGLLHRGVQDPAGPGVRHGVPGER